MARIVNLIAPETPTSRDAQLPRRIQQCVATRGDQDKVVLEAQQIEADRAGSLDPGVVLGIDSGPIQGRRVLKAALLQDA